jgi:hypothetical protein
MPEAGAAARIEDLALFIICQKFEKGGDDTIVMAVMASRLFQSGGQKLPSPQPSPQPSPGGRGGRPRCLAGYVDLKDFGDYGFGEGPWRLWLW